MIFPLLVIECISPMGCRTWIIHPPRLGWVGMVWVEPFPSSICLSFFLLHHAFDLLSLSPEPG